MITGGLYRWANRRPNRPLDSPGPVIGRRSALHVLKAEIAAVAGPIHAIGNSRSAIGGDGDLAENDHLTVLREFHGVSPVLRLASALKERLHRGMADASRIYTVPLLAVHTDYGPERNSHSDRRQLRVPREVGCVACPTQTQPIRGHTPSCFAWDGSPRPTHHPQRTPRRNASRKVVETARCAHRKAA